MRKYKVFLLGNRNYFANSEEEAIKQAEKDLQYFHQNFNMDISGVKEFDEEM